MSPTRTPRRPLSRLPAELHDIGHPIQSSRRRKLILGADPVLVRARHPRISRPSRSSGHTSIQTTRNIYTEWDVDRLAQTLEQIGND